MSGKRWSLHLDRLFRGRGAHHRIRRINNPGETALRVFIVVCVLALLASLTVVLVRSLAGEPEFRPLAAEEAGS